MLATNQILHKGRYRIINAFSQDETGGMYEAYDTVSNTNVVLRENIGNVGKVATSTQLEAINAEFAGGAKVLTKIAHESLVSVHDYFSEIDCQYLVLEAVTGFDLTEYLKTDEERPSLDSVLSWADQLLGALNYLHRLSPPLFHADVRPENIKLTTGEKVKLLTAGRFASPETGQMGTDAAFHYRPLEQLWPELNPATQRVILNSYDEKSAGLLMQPLDARSDLYSVAASLYHVLTGTLPCDALDRSITILDGKPDPLDRPTDLDESITPEISDVFMRAMAIRRENRFDSAASMLQLLRAAAAPAGDQGAKKSFEAESSDPHVEAVETLDPKASPVQYSAAVPNDEEPDLLELETAEPRLSSSSETFELLEDDLFEDVEEDRPAIKESYAPAFDLTQPSPSRLRIPAIAGAAVLLLGVLFGGWMYVSSVQTVPPPAAVQTTLTADQPVQMPASDAPPASEQVQTIEPAPSAEAKPVVEEPAQVNEKNSQPQLNTAADKLKKPAPAPAKTPPPKKKVTVDDLINDN